MYSNKFLLVYTGAMLMVTASLLGQPSNSISLPEAIQLALVNNEALKVLGYEQQITRNSVDPSMVGMGPTIQLQARALIGYGDAEVETINLGPPEAENPPLALSGIRHGIQVQPEASWLIFDGGASKSRLAQLRLVDEGAAIALQAAQEQTVAQLSSLYLQACQLEEQLAVATDNIALSNERLRRVKKANAFGTQNSLDILQAEVNVNEDSVAYYDLTLAIINSKKQLNQLMGRPSATPLELVSVITRQLPNRLLSLDSLKQNLLTNNEDIREAQNRLAIQTEAVTLANTANKPMVQLYANVGYFRQTDNANFLLENRNIGTEAGVNFSYALFDGGKRKIEQQNARLRLEQSQQNKTALESQLLNALEQSYQRYQNNYRQLAFAQQNLRSFEENFNKSQADYQLGQLDATTLRAAQLALTAAQTRIILAEFQLHLEEIELLRLTGGLVR